MFRVPLLISALVTAVHGQQPVQLAAQARLWLKVPPDQPPLGEVRVAPGAAQAAAWERDPAVRARLTDMTVPIRWWDWTTITISFTPAKDGAVELDLNGPWSPERNGLMPKQVVWWDGLSATGTELRNGGFEEQSGAAPDAWRAPWVAYAAPDAEQLAQAEPCEGKQVAATWSKAPLAQTLRLKAGVPVTLSLRARAALPPDFVAPKRLPPGTPAHQAAARLKRGVNLGNGFESTPGQGWGVKFTTEDIDRIAAEGFDHIRVPVAWHFRVQRSDGRWLLNPAFLATLEPLLHRALEKNLRVILNWHHFNDLTASPAAHRERFIGVWEAIARRYQTWSPDLMFELLNEPCDALTTEVANPIHAEAIAAIRRSNPDRIIFVSPGHFGSVSELGKLRLPDGDDRLVVTFHCYAPFHFTHQGAGWVKLTALRGVRFPGPPDEPLALPAALRDNAGVRSFLESYNSLPAAQNPCSGEPVREVFEAALGWSGYFGRPVHLGEFGCHDAGDPASRGRYLRAVRTLAEARRIPWTLWEWKASFGYWDPAAARPRFRQELME